MIVAPAQAAFDRPSVEPIPRLSLRPPEAAKAMGIGTRKLWEITADRTSGIPHIRFGKAILYPVRELQAWLGRQANGDGL